MLGSSMTRPRPIFLVGVALVATMALAGVVGRWYLGRARITGDTAEARVACVSEIVARGASGAGRALARAAVKDPAPTVRAAALAGLARFRGPSERAAVQQGTRDAEASVRAAAVNTLCQYHDAPAADRLGELVRADPEANVREQAVFALGVCRSPKATVVLMQVAEGADAPDLRLRALESLLAKSNITFHRKPDPRDVRRWKDTIEWAKCFPSTQEAFVQAGVTLVRHPEDLIVSRHDVEEPRAKEKQP